MDLWKLVSMLANRALYFPVVATLGDQLEAAPLELPEGSSNLDKFKQWHFWRQWCCTFFVSCWHCAPHESDAMWRIYAGRNQGIAINSTFQALSDAFDPAGADAPPEHLIRAGLVAYIAPDSKEPMFRRAYGDEHVLRKRGWYAYEKELRLIIERAGNFIEPRSLVGFGRYKTGGIWVRCDLGKLIRGVVLSPASPKFYESTVRELLKAFGIDPQLVRPSKLNEAFIPPDQDLVREEFRSLQKRGLLPRKNKPRVPKTPGNRS